MAKWAIALFFILAVDHSIAAPLINGSSCIDLFESGEQLNLDRPIRFTPFQVRSNYAQYIGQYNVTTWKPKAGPGRFIVIRPLENIRSSFHETVLAFPDFFAKFDIHADFNELIIPDSQRLNNLLHNGVQFLDIPFYLPQFYGERYFSKTLQRRFIPLASRGTAFLHDRTQEHLLGALIIPQWLFEKFLVYQKSQASQLKNFRPPSAVWDKMTSSLGQIVGRMAKNKTATLKNISDLKQVLLYYGNDLTPTPKITEEMALSEAIRTIREVTGENEP